MAERKPSKQKRWVDKPLIARTVTQALGPGMAQTVISVTLSAAEGKGELISAWDVKIK